MENDIQAADDSLQIDKILGLVKLMQGLNNSRDEAKKEPQVHTENNKLTFDEEFQSPALKAIKAAIPYLDYKYQRNLGLMVKVIEMDRLVQKYSALAVEGAEIHQDNKKEMLMAIKPELNVRHQKVLDIFLKIAEIKELAEDLENE